MVRAVLVNANAILDLVRALHDLERVGHVHRPRDPRQVALKLGVAVDPVGGVLVLDGPRLRLVRDPAVALDDAERGGDAAGRAPAPPGTGRSRTDTAPCWVTIRAVEEGEVDAGRREVEQAEDVRRDHGGHGPRRHAEEILAGQRDEEDPQVHLQRIELRDGDVLPPRDGSRLGDDERSGSIANPGGRPHDRQHIRPVHGRAVPRLRPSRRHRAGRLERGQGFVVRSSDSAERTEPAAAGRLPRTSTTGISFAGVESD